MNVLSAVIFSAPMAADTANRKMNQKTIAPMRCDGELPGETRSTYGPASDSLSFWSTFSESRTLLMAVFAILAMT